MSLRFRQKTAFVFFDLNSKSRDQEVSKQGSKCNMPSGPAGQALFYSKVWITPLFKCSSHVEDKNVCEKKVKKDHTKNFFDKYFFVILVSPVVRF